MCMARLIFKKITPKVGLFFAILSFFLCGCSSSENAIDETDEKHYQRGQRLLKEGRNPEALEAFLIVIDKRSDAPESHFEAGRLYLHEGIDPIAAIYHLRRYVRARPQSEQTPMVKQMIETAQKQFAKNLPGKPFGDESDNLELLEMLELERLKNEELTRALQDAQKRLKAEQRHGTALPASAYSNPTLPNASATTQAKPDKLLVSESKIETGKENTASGQESTYIVQPGDSLSKISQTVYGTPSKWPVLLEANASFLKAPKDLRPGQVLKVPQL
jgi:nucleoid-associated protein YgaU